MRRFNVLLLAFILVFSLSSCAANNQTTTSEDVKTTPQASENTSAQTATEETKANRRVIRVGMECDYAPNNWQESTSTDTNLPIENAEGFFAEGYDVQISKLIAKDLDADVVIVKLAWSGLIEALNSGQIDLIVASMSDTGKRRESINFSDRYSISETEYGIMVKQGSKYSNAKSLDDLNGASVLGQKDTALDDVIDQIAGVDHLNPVSAISNMLTRLNEGTADAIVVDLESADAALQAHPNLQLIRFEKGNGFVLDFTGACIGIRKSDTDLLEEVNTALAKISIEQRQQMMDTALAGVPK